MVQILVVDDDKSIREMLHLMLQCLGYDVVEAPDGPEALEILRAAPHRCVVLLDLMMPKLDGLEVLRIVADDEYLSTHHLYILVSAIRDLNKLSEDDTVMKLSVPIISKPFSTSHLLAVVEQMMQRAHCTCNSADDEKCS